MASVFPPPPTIPPRKRTTAERVADAIKNAVEEVGLYASRKIFIDAQLADRGGVPRLKFKDALRAVMYADRDGFLQPLGWEGWTASMDVTLQQQNAAGGAIAVDVTIGAGSEMIVLASCGVNSGTNGINASIQDSGNNIIAYFFAIASAAGTIGRVSIGNAGTAVNTTDSPSGLGFPVFVSPPDKVTLQQTAAGAQNDTLRVAVRVRIKHKGQLPVASIARSTNPGNVVATSGALSFSVEE